MNDDVETGEAMVVVEPVFYEGRGRKIGYRILINGMIYGDIVNMLRIFGVFGGAS